MQLSLVLALSAALPRLSAGDARQASNPIARVVGLLKGLQTKLEQDFEAEKSLFERYECWYKSIVDTKSASNTAAQTRKESLETYIQDIESGKFEFTTERVDLEKQIAGLRQDLQVAADLRSKEGDDYQAAKAEMEKAVSALDDAIQVLEDAAPSSLLASQSSVSQLRARQSFQEVVLLGRSALAAADLKFLERTIVGDVPNPDWKKLNRKATFKMKYGSQTGRIIKTLKDLKFTFTESLSEAEQKENAAQAAYNTLKGSKEGMLNKADQALVDMVAEHGARALTKSEAQAEVDALGAQITADNRFISETQTSYNAKQQEWSNRERLRQMEIAAISEAIAVLHSDDARDTFKTSYSFVQARQEVDGNGHLLRATRLATATSTLQKLASASGDARLSLLAVKSGTRSIAKVIEQIDNLLTTLKAEETSDLTNKEGCESQRAEKTREAKVESVAIDEYTDEITRAQAKVVELEAQMKEQEEAINELNGTLVDLERQRTDEHAQYLKDKADDQAAIALIEQAAQVMQKLKTDLLAGLAVKSNVHSSGSKESKTVAAPAGLASVRVHLSQRSDAEGSSRSTDAAETHIAAAHRQSSTSHSQQPVEVNAGEAPPPPPATWADPTYTGSTDEHKGLHAILTLLKDDIAADVTAADTTETEAVSTYNTQKGDVQAAIQAANDAISGYVAEKATQDTTIVNKGGERSSKKAELQGTMGEIAAMRDGCDFILINYDARRTNRQIEMDGLEKAKAYLAGADFS